MNGAAEVKTLGAGTLTGATLHTESAPADEDRCRPGTTERT